MISAIRISKLPILHTSTCVHLMFQYIFTVCSTDYIQFLEVAMGFELLSNCT